MKNKIHRVSLESALAHTFEACEKKSGESITQLYFKNDKLTLSCKGSFTQYEETINVESVNEDCVFSLKTSILLEFVRHTLCDDIILAYDNQKQSCLISSGDKKSKIAIQTVDYKINKLEDEKYEIIFKNINLFELTNKLYFASKFCSLNFEDYPLTGIHCLITDEIFEIKSTNGPAFYKSTVKKESTQDFEFYLPKKSPNVIKNIFNENPIKMFSVKNDSILLENETCKLKIFLEKCEKDSFPTQITEWTEKDSSAKIRVSSYELFKSIKFLNNIASDSSVNFVIKNDSLNIESKESTAAAKETIELEEVTGEAVSAYSPKLLLDCLDSLTSHWVTIDFIKMQDDFCLCKLTGEDTTTLLCPTIF